MADIDARHRQLFHRSRHPQFHHRRCPPHLAGRYEGRCEGCQQSSEGEGDEVDQELRMSEIRLVGREGVVRYCRCMLVILYPRRKCLVKPCRTSNDSFGGRSFDRKPTPCSKTVTAPSPSKKAERVSILGALMILPLHKLGLLGDRWHAQECRPLGLVHENIHVTLRLRPEHGIHR